MFRHLLAFTTAVTAAIAQATVANIACDRDNTLFEHPAGALSGGAESGLFVGVTAQQTGALRRALVRFDVAAVVPAGARIVAAELMLNVSLGNPTVIQLDVMAHRALADWGEGTSTSVGGLGGGGSGGPASPGDATWLHTFFPNQLWASPGGDFAAAPSLTLGLFPVGPATSSTTAGAIADVQSWLDSPAQNFGWLLKSDELVAASARRIDSRENLAGIPPTLRVTYLTPGQTTTWGTGCPVGGATFQHAWSGAAAGGTSPNLTQTNGPPSQFAANLLSLSWDPVGFPLLPQCDLYLPITFVVNQGIFQLDGAGAGSTPLNLPAGFPGVVFTSQTAALDPLATNGYVLSNLAIALLQ